MDADDPLVKSRKTVNPYFHGLGMILRRLYWDIHPQSFVSRSKLRKLKDCYSGKKAVILCNGPSLNKVNFQLLSDSGVYCFGLNKINLLFGRVDFRPDCIVSVNQLVIEQNAAYYNTSDIDLFIDSTAATRRLVRPRGNVAFIHSTNFQKFARDVSVSLNQGHTVTCVALQLAFHMGFTSVALVGADHTFAVQGAANKAVTAGERDDSHFDPNYFASGVKWHLPDLFESEVWYGRARQVYTAHDRKILNCTEGGELDVFDRQTLEQFLAI
jgi:hypothetical protein